MDNNYTKTAIITGAGAGIGRATALALLNAGYAVALAGRNIETLQATEELAGHNRSNAVSIVTDISDPHSILNLFSEVKKQFGRLDLLFNNAGIGAGNSLLEELSIDQWKQVVDINLTGSFICTQLNYLNEVGGLEYVKKGSPGIDTTAPDVEGVTGNGRYQSFGNTSLYLNAYKFTKIFGHNKIKYLSPYYCVSDYIIERPEEEENPKFVGG